MHAFRPNPLDVLGEKPGKTSLDSNGFNGDQRGRARFRIVLKPDFFEDTSRSREIGLVECPHFHLAETSLLQLFYDGRTAKWPAHRQHRNCRQKQAR